MCERTWTTYILKLLVYVYGPEYPVEGSVEKLQCPIDSCLRKEHGLILCACGRVRAGSEAALRGGLVQSQNSSADKVPAATAGRTFQPVPFHKLLAEESEATIIRDRLMKVNFGLLSSIAVSGSGNTRDAETRHQPKFSEKLKLPLRIRPAVSKGAGSAPVQQGVAGGAIARTTVFVPTTT